jgi:hypothetical protein
MEITMKNTKRDTTNNSTKEEAKPNNKSGYGYKETKGTKREKEDANSMNNATLTGYKLIEKASKMLARKHKSLTLDAWRKEASELYSYNEGFDGEPVSLDWFISKLEDKVASRYSNQDSTHSNLGGESDLQSFLELKKKGFL